MVAARASRGSRSLETLIAGLATVMLSACAVQTSSTSEDVNQQASLDDTGSVSTATPNESLNDELALADGNDIEAPTSNLAAPIADSTIEIADSSLDTDGTAPSVDSVVAAAIKPEVLVNQAGSDIGIQLVKGDSFTNVTITTNGQTPRYNVTQLKSPDRVVVDLASPVSRLNRVFDVANSDVLNRVRLGAHPDKSRLVLDLSTTASVAHKVTETPNGVTIQLFTPTALASSEAQLSMNTTPSMRAMPNLEETGATAVTESATESSEAIVATETSSDETVDAAHEHDKEALLDAAPAKTWTEPVAVDSPRLVGLTIEAAGGTENLLVAELSNSTPFTLSRTAPSEYVLTIDKATVETTAAQTLIAPPNSGAIKSVRPIKQDSGVQLRIFTEPTATLESKVAGNKIVISSNSVARADEDLRAQMNPEVTKTENSDGAKAEATKSDKKEVVQQSPTESVVSAILQDQPKYTGRLISLDLQDTDIDNALRIIAEVSNLNIIASGDVTGKVTLRLIDVPWDQALDVILKTNNLDKVQEGNVIRIAPVEKLRNEREQLKQAQQAEEELEALKVRYIRVNYAKASDLKPLVETVVTERGSVAYDERSNQIIVKDIQKGIVNVADLIAKLDLRTPQVLLETQIVEASRNLLRDLGVELGFEYIQSPATGNATGMNFPNSISIGGGVPGGAVSSFPAAISAAAGSAISAVFDSADGSKSLTTTLSALETEGRVRIVSRPSVATINNKQAMIKSVEKIRIRLPSGGTSVATGQGASASSGNTSATEVVEVGITLEVTPQASPDYYVLLDINAKSSTLGSTVVDTIPSEIERSATSTVLVSSGQTFALGGIYKITDRDAINGVPFFKDIPFLGHLFRNSVVDNKDEELIFFITPRIVEGSFDDASMKMSS